MSERKKDTVKFYNDQRGFGFLQPTEGGDDVFVHVSGVAQGVTLQDGQAVTYLQGFDNKKGNPIAEDVRAA